MFVCGHRHRYGSAPTDSTDPASQLAPLLAMSAEAWENSRVRHALPDELREHMDSLDKDRLRAEIRLMRDQAATSGRKAVVGAMEAAYEATGPSRSSMRTRASYSTATRGIARPTAAITIGMAAVGKGKTARFFTVAELIMHLVETNRCGRTERQLTNIGKADLLILDELGYMPPNIEGTRLPYQVMANAREKQSAVITTNIEFSK